MKEFYAKHKKKIIIVAVILVAGGIYWKFFYKKADAQVRYVLETASKQTITQAISGSGQVKALSQLDIKPLVSGTLVQMKVKDGDQVKAGQVLAVVDQRNAAASLAQAKASLDSAEANYQKVISGATNQELAVNQLSVQSAQNGLDKANKDLDSTKRQQDTLVGNAYRNMLNSGLAATPGSGNTGSSTVTVSGAYIGTDQGSYTISIYATGGGLRFSYSGLETGDGLVDTVPKPLGTKGLYVQFSSTSIPVNNVWTVSLPNVTSSGYLNSYNSYQSALQSRQDAIDNAQQAIVSAQNSLDQAKANLALKQEPATADQIASAQAQVSSAKAQLLNASTAYSNTIITAPFDGAITQADAKVGDQASPSTAIAVLLTNQKVVEISLNEVDVAKVQVGQKATITFDALSDLSLTGHITQIDLVGTVSQGVVSYNVQISLDNQDDRIKPGMSANANIILDVKTDVLAVPNSAIKTLGNNSYVEVLANPPANASDPSGVISVTPPVQKPVQIGMSNDEVTEITSGLNEGDSVVVQTVNPAATKTTQTQSSGGFGLPGVGGGGNFNRVIRSTSTGR